MAGCTFAVMEDKVHQNGKAVHQSSFFVDCLLPPLDMLFKIASLLVVLSLGSFVLAIPLSPLWF